MIVFCDKKERKKKKEKKKQISVRKRKSLFYSQIINSFKYAILLRIIYKTKTNKNHRYLHINLIADTPVADLEGGVRGVRPGPKIRKAYVIQR